MESIIEQIVKVKNYWFPVNPVSTTSPEKIRDINSKNLDRYITPVQLNRIKQDIQSWREAIQEAELPFYPQRVKMQRLYQDVINDGHVFSAIERRKDLSLLKDFHIIDKSGKELEDLTKLFKNKWFFDLMSYVLDARFFGYSLIGLGDIVDNKFPNLEVIRRHNVSPDRENLTAYVYALSGIAFNNPDNKDEDGNSFYDWSIWVKTPSDIGVSPCGYGLLYKIAMYQIYIRNNIGWNADFVEMFAQPYRQAKTSKTEGPEYDQLENSMKNMGSSGYIITDPIDEISFIEGNKSGRGHDSYDNFELRNVKVVNKLVFGHADALDSQTGKLGGEDAAKAAVLETEKKDNRFFEYECNDQIIPKLRNIGFVIPEGTTFQFKNDREKEEQKNKEDDSNVKVATYVKTFKDAGIEVDPKFIEERTGIPVKKAEVKDPLITNPNIPKGIKNKLEDLYK